MPIILSWSCPEAWELLDYYSVFSVLLYIRDKSLELRHLRKIDAAAWYWIYWFRTFRISIMRLHLLFSAQKVMNIVMRYCAIKINKILKCLSQHTVRNLHFLSNNSTLISRKNFRFFGWKTRETVVVLGFLAVDNFDFTRKIVKKKFGWKTRQNVGVLSKLNFWTKIWLFE